MPESLSNNQNVQYSPYKYPPKVKDIYDRMRDNNKFQKYPNPWLKLVANDSVLSVDWWPNWNIDGFNKNNENVDLIFNVQWVRDWIYVRDPKSAWKEMEHMAYKKAKYFEKEEKVTVTNPETWKEEEKKIWNMYKIIGYKNWEMLLDDTKVDIWSDEYYYAWESINFFDSFLMMQWDKTPHPDKAWTDWFTKEWYPLITKPKKISVLIESWAMRIKDLQEYYTLWKITEDVFQRWIEQIAPKKVAIDEIKDTVMYKQCLDKRFWEHMVTKEEVELYQSAWYLYPEMVRLCVEAIDIRDNNEEMRQDIFNESRANIWKIFE